MGKNMTSKISWKQIAVSTIPPSNTSFCAHSFEYYTESLNPDQLGFKLFENV